MKRRQKRQIVCCLLTLIVLTLLAVVLRAQETSLQRSSFTSGYLMQFSLMFLAAYNFRKKLPGLPLGTSAAWLQLHIYVGFSSVAIFLMHIGFAIPNGRFECFLAMLYLIVASSGVYGLYLTRTIPRKLTAIPEQVVFERIPALRQQMSMEARELVLSHSGDSTLFAHLYKSRLSNFFDCPRSMAYYLFPNGKIRRALISDINDMNRYLSQSQRSITDQLTALVFRKDDVDYHHALQGRLKVWLFLHIGFTYGLLATAILHAIMVHAFHGAMR